MRILSSGLTGITLGVLLRTASRRGGVFLHMCENLL